MTYNTPELLLVGAAQNLVLAGSNAPNKIPDDDCGLFPSEEGGDHEYNDSTSW
jgi:hypothetical protein